MSYVLEHGMALPDNEQASLLESFDWVIFTTNAKAGLSGFEQVAHINGLRIAYC